MSSTQESVKEVVPAVDATFKHKISKEDLFGVNELNINKQGDKNEKTIQKEIEKVLFSKDITEVTKLENVNKLLEPSTFGTDKFNEVFKAEKKPLVIGPDKGKAFLYKKASGFRLNMLSDKGTAIRIICAAYFKNDDSDGNKIIIASRLDTEHAEDPTPPHQQQTTGGAPPLNMINAIEKLIGDNEGSIKKILDADKLTDEFKKKMTEILKPKYIETKKDFVENSTVYEEYSISDKLEPDINEKILKFNVEFSIIFVENKKTIYYSKNIKKFEDREKFDGNYKDASTAPAAPAPVAAAPVAAAPEPVAAAPEPEEQKKKLEERVDKADDAVNK